jgi:hypothetical protein
LKGSGFCVFARRNFLEDIRSNRFYNSIYSLQKACCTLKLKIYKLLYQYKCDEREK